MTAAPGSPSKPRSDRPPAEKRKDPWDTPAMRQFARFKAQHPECLLLFRMGDFYELFDDDAVTAHKALGLTLTERANGIPMAGVPHHAMETYLRRLIEQGYRVAVCDQIQDPKDAKGIVDRAVTRVLTPGTLVDDALLDEGQANHLVAITDAHGGRATMAVAELSTGSFTLQDIDAASVVDELARLGPSEILCPETADGPAPALADAARALGASLTPRPGWTFRPSDAGDLLREHFGVATLTGFGLDDDDPATAAAGALLRYLQETQSPADAPGEGRLGHLRPPRRESTADYVTIDATSLRSLEIERTMRTGSIDGSLMSVVQRCRTAMGKRLLRQWLCFPLRDRERIERRQRAVAALRADATFAEALGTETARVQDVARIAGRIAMGRATPRDLVALGRSASALPQLRELLADRPAFAARAARLDDLDRALGPLATRIAETCEEAPPAHLRDGGLFRDGVDTELDEARGLQRNATDWLARYQQELIASCAIPSLKVGYNKVFGYYIEITHAHVAKVPEAFHRKQTLKNAERYITPELKTFEEKVTTAETRAIEREKVLFDELCTEAAQRAEVIVAYADAIAELDVLLCFAEIADRFGLVAPELADEPVLDIRQGRHPVLDRLLAERFVPNDCALGVPGEDGTATLALITGPNMAGKSTYIRQVALIVLLAHTGSCVPADSARIGLVDRIFTRIGASDELHAGQSTFMVEMTETANILHHVTPRSLVILDEIGRGTSTLDGLSLAWAIAETLAERGARTLFATHYHELTGLAERLPAITNLHVAVREWQDEVVFLHRILPGSTDRSYGIHVAQLAGLPAPTVARASELLETLTVHSESEMAAAGPTPPAPAPGGQLGLFTEYLPHPVVDELREAEIETMSPLEAFDLLRRLRERACE